MTLTHSVYTRLPHTDIYGDIDFYAEDKLATFNDRETAIRFMNFFNAKFQYSWFDDDGVNYCADFNPIYPNIESFS